MAQTTILSSITKSGSYPLSTDLTAKDHCGTMSISLTGTWTTQMIHEMPTINFGVFMQDGTKLVSIDFDMSTFTSDNGGIDTVNPYTIALYDLPEEFTIKVTPIFDKYALQSHNAQVEAGDVSVFDTTDKGIVDTNTSDYSALLWTTSTTTFNMAITFDDSNISSGGGGGSSSADQIVFVPPADMTSTDVQNAIEELDTKINDLPEPMIFKGSLGTGGTITTLPAASDANKGFTYKVITAGTYQGVTAEIGDTLISDGTTWVLIPSGDEPSGTVTNVAVSNTDGSMTITGSPITSSGTIDISLNPATTNTLGGVLASDSINVDSNGVMDLGQSVGGDGLEVVSGSVLPAEYTPVEYLYGTGQCIQNLYAMTANGIRIETEFACDVPSSGEIDIIGGGGDPNWTNVPILILQTSATINGASGHNTDVTLTDYQIATWLYNTYAISGVTPSINTFHTVVADWYIVNGQMSITVDGDTHSYNCEYTRATNLCLFGNGQGGNNPANIKMKYLKIYQGSMDYPAMNLIPVKNFSNVYGMYDTISGTFFTKTGGTGDFSGGSEITLPTSSVINVIPATTNTLGGVIVGDSLAVDNTGVLSFNPPIMTLQEYNDLQTKDSPIYFIYEQ